MATRMALLAAAAKYCFQSETMNDLSLERFLCRNVTQFLAVSSLESGHFQV